VRVWDLDTCTPLVTLKGHDGWVQSLAWSPDEAYLVSSGMDGTVRMWHMAPSGTKTGLSKMGEPYGGGPLKGHKGPVTSIVWEPLHR
jgi:ribosome assembly protein 4